MESYQAQATLQVPSNPKSFAQASGLAGDQTIQIGPNCITLVGPKFAAADTITLITSCLHTIRIQSHGERINRWSGNRD